jgi:hypothetical protein
MVLGCPFDELLELFAVGFEGLAAIFRHAAQGHRNFAAIGLLYAYVTGLFQF